jgi:hypothetical protein
VEENGGRVLLVVVPLHAVVGRLAASLLGSDISELSAHLFCHLFQGVVFHGDDEAIGIVS